MIDRLYEKIGGSRTINELVRIFYDRVLADPLLSPFFPNTDMDTLRAQQVMFMTMLLGGARSFKGRDLGTAHAAARMQGLADAHFDALLSHFGAALEELEVEEDYVREILTLLEATRDAVLGRQART
jgi:hemoglobin